MLSKVKWIIALSQIGRIWTYNRKVKRIFQTFTALGFLALFYANEKSPSEQQEINDFNNTIQ